MKKILFTLSIIAIFSACKSEKTEQMLLQIDQLSASVDSSGVELATIDTSIISIAKKNAESQLMFISEFYSDTNYEHARYIDVYNSNFKLMRKLLKGYNRIHTEIDFSINQLTNLSNDVKNGFAADSSYSKHLEGEIKAVNNIKSTTATLKAWEEKSVKRYNGMVPSIDSIITELKNQGFR